ncbi:hypothetical protein LXA47_17020 [Massilia sp. P8910]|uniref:hypothetical protein n=1 Tax=Massilia antarctica TaxID=2765360 RepID=UPI0006BB7618|nr:MULTISPECIES: hypothetical protein [Massilia]MCE3605294.1 hypothetical protein [Massilia antarctica]MCY0914117.1 hypothetical protein [Massilia sp. H27-R4]CUI08515.1 hypothetical protein BN2497_11807 [Janthinobacterium sp. CG23_2]CUU32301.1 hypothetical protein BN3177_11807 [Janthinobacterium sp. CG23_2]
MTQPDFIPFIDVVDQIASFCSQRVTGTALLISDDNRMAQVHLQGGKIVFILCRGRRGRDGLAIMRTMQNARLTLDKAGVVNADGLDWPTEIVLGYLDGTLDDLPGNGVLGGAAPRPAAAAPRPAATPGLTQEIKATLQRCLVKYVGPMAEIVCGDHFDGATDVRAVVMALAKEIPNEDQAAKFKVDVAKALDMPAF